MPDAASLSIVIPAQAGIQQKHISRTADDRRKVVLLRRQYLINWIPACAGMTGLLEFNNA
jgi:hypothetical protein